MSKLGDFKKVGRLLAELAQTYSRLGQSQEALAKRCCDSGALASLTLVPRYGFASRASAQIALY